jgi:UDP-glucose 4-epimerase
VLITGARGFIGRHLAARLADSGCTVTGIGHGAWPTVDAQRCGLRNWFNGDVSRHNLGMALRESGRIDRVFHLAGGSSVGPSLQAPEEDFRRSVVSTAELLEWVRTEAPEAKVVFASSAAVYGRGHSSLLRPEAPLRPFSPYGSHKRMAEELLISYASSFGISTAVVRLFSVYGPGLRKQILWELCSRLAAGVDGLVLGGTGSEKRDFIHVSDAVRYLLGASPEACETCPIFNAGTGEAVTVGEISAEVCRLWGCSAPRFSGVSRAGDPMSLVADVSGSALLDASQPCTSWREGVAEYVRWFRSTAARED